MNKSATLAFVAVVALTVAGFLIFRSPIPAPTADIKQNVENYLRENIVELSPVQAVLGGTWYVVSSTINLETNSGTVHYEDGHIDEQRNFTYTINAAGEVASLTITSSISNKDKPVACTMEAKQCPDGSYVGRTGPNCEFSQCPDISTAKSGVKGRVTLSPTCPVERDPPEPGCAPKPYETSISIRKAGSTQIIRTIKSDQNGAFTTELAPGNYTLQAQGGSVMPTCPEVSVVVKSGQYATANISCDTGIR